MENIFQAIRIKNIEEYSGIINNIDINVLNNYNQSLLQESISHNNDEVSYDLIKRGINLNHRDKDGKTALHYCASHNKSDIMKVILEKGCDVNVCDNYGNNPLWVAVFNARGNYEMVNLLISYNANVNNKNNVNKTPLDFASQIQDEKLVEILHKSNMDL